MKEIQQQMVKSKMKKRANALKEVKRMCKGFVFTAGKLEGDLTNSRCEK